MATTENAIKAKSLGFSGHPRGLSTLFFTEMWERFSYYGLRAILFLYMTRTLGEGGLAFDQKYAGLVMGTYTSSVYWTPLIGGWLADKYLGARRAVFIGGIVIACGHFSMAIKTMPSFYGGLALIAIGTGLLKPNVSTMVGDLYAEGDERRDAGFSIFYMGINLGAFIAPIICSYLGQRIDWHYGFAAAGFGMTLGLVQYSLGGKRLQGVGLKPAQVEPKTSDDLEKTETDYLTIALAVIGCVVGFYFGLFTGVLGLFFGYLAGVIRHLNVNEKKRVGVIFILFVFSALFWMSFEQAATSLTLFANDLTRNSIFGWDFPSGWFQSVQPTFVILLAPLFAWIWLNMGKRQPSSPGKFVIGLIFAAAAFAVVALASTFTGGGRVSPFWLVLVYLLQTMGEVCLYPVGLSTVTKLSPARMMGAMMGVWLLSISVGNYLAGILAGSVEVKSVSLLVRFFGIIALVTLVGAILLLALTPTIKRMSSRAS